MIAAIGIDLVYIPQLEKACASGDDFVQSIFTSKELCDCTTVKANWRVERLGARFAAKEAVPKVFGVGISGGISLKDIQVESLPSGMPILVLSGEAKRLSEKRGFVKWVVSLSHSGEYAIAVVLATGQGS